MSKKSEREAERESALDHLRALCPPGTTVYCVLERVSRSGMQREIKLYTFDADGEHYLSGYVSHALDYAPRGKHDGNVVNGCGMDMGFHLVSNLSAALYPNGFGCIGEKCPSNDHSNGDRDYSPAASLGSRDACAVCGTDIEYTGDGWWDRGGNFFCSQTESTKHVPYTHKVAHWHRSGDYALRHRWL